MMQDPIWTQLDEEARHTVQTEPLLASYVYACILNHDSLGSALSFLLANKLSDEVMPAIAVRELFEAAYRESPDMIFNAISDMQAVYDRDAATNSYLPILLFLKGYQSIQVHRLAHFLWKKGRKTLAFFIQSRSSDVFGVDIHPACVISR